MRALRAACLALAAAPAAAEEACRDDRIDLRGDWGRAAITVDVADTPQAQARGLMFVEAMPRGEGMLFAYDSPRRVSFWMRNTLIPLDMLFMSPDGVVTRVHEGAVPGDETPIPGGEGGAVRPRDQRRARLHAGDRAGHAGPPSALRRVRRLALRGGLSAGRPRG